MTTRVNRQWRLVARPVGLFKPTDFEWHENPAPDPGEGQVLVKVECLSLDPTNRGWASMDTYLPAVPLGEVMRGIAIGRVEASRNPAWPVGTRVQGLLGWQDYHCSDGAGLHRIPDVPADVWFGALGHIGLTAYCGLLDVGQPKAGETLVISAAAGAVGSLVGQIGKIKGCRVVGIAGGPEKCAWLTGELGFDAAVDYKAGKVLPALKAACPGGIDVVFENVGGEILDASLALINLRARIALCGLISGYAATRREPGPYNFGNVLVRRARIEGFIAMDFVHRAQEAYAQLGQWLAEGRLKYRVDTVHGLDHAVLAVNRLFEGTNHGKLIVMP
jgi:NADPH-dependent curcumin reductase CurA